MLSDQIETLITTRQKVSLGELLALFKNASFGMLLALIALPSALPLPAPGYSIPFGLMIVLLAGQILWGRTTPWFPSFCLKPSFKLTPYVKGIDKIRRFIEFFERFIHPRFTGVFWGKNRLLGLALLLCGLLMCIPIPGTNTIPALAVFIMGLSITERDGLMALVGLGLSLIGLTILVGLLLMGARFLELFF